MKKGDFSEKWEVIKSFKENVLDNFAKYQVPVIALGPKHVQGGGVRRLREGQHRAANLSTRSSW